MKCLLSLLYIATIAITSLLSNVSAGDCEGMNYVRYFYVIIAVVAGFDHTTLEDYHMIDDRFQFLLILTRLI
jgi:hypothetical protein